MAKDELIHQEFARVRASLVALKEAVDRTGPPCSECVFGISFYRDGGSYLSHTCGHPVYVETHYDPVTGVTSQRKTVRLTDARRQGELCGPEASLFERYDPEPRRGAIGKILHAVMERLGV